MELGCIVFSLDPQIKRAPIRKWVIKHSQNLECEARSTLPRFANTNTPYVTVEIVAHTLQGVYYILSDSPLETRFIVL